MKLIFSILLSLSFIFFAQTPALADANPNNIAHEDNPIIRLQERCNSGDGQSCQEMGTKLKDGTGIRRNPEQARIFFDKACKYGITMGCNDLAFLMVRGDGGPVDIAGATDLLEAACAKNAELSCFNYAIVVSMTNPLRGVDLYRQACDGGSEQACYNIGTMYGDGKTVARDEVIAMLYYRRACDGGLMRGCTAIQIMEQNQRLANAEIGKPIEVVIAELEQNCTNQSALACNDLAMRLFQGDGIERNWPRAAELFKRSCENNGITACFNLGTLYSQGQGVSKDPSAAASLFLRACEGGNKVSCQTLAELYLFGEGIGKSTSEAERIFTTLCEEGRVVSCISLAEFHENNASGKGSTEAKKWYEKALTIDANNAQARLGITRLNQATNIH